MRSQNEFIGTRRSQNHWRFSNNLTKSLPIKELLTGVSMNVFRAYKSKFTHWRSFIPYITLRHNYKHKWRVNERWKWRFLTDAQRSEHFYRRVCQPPELYAQVKCLICQHGNFSSDAEYCLHILSIYKKALI